MGNITHFLLVTTFSANTSTQWAALNSRMYRGSLGRTGQRSEMDRILQANTPEFTCNAEVLATPHQRIALAGFGRSWNSRGVEVLLLAPCDRYQPRNYLSISQGRLDRSGHLPRHTSAYSLLTTFGPTFVSLRGASPHPPGPKALLRMRRYLISGRYIRPSVMHFRVDP